MEPGEVKSYVKLYKTLERSEFFFQQILKFLIINDEFNFS